MVWKEGISYSLAPFDGSTSGIANSVNNLGVVAGQAQTQFANHVTVFTQQRTVSITRIGGILSVDGLAFRINDGGQVAGYMRFSVGYRPFLFSNGQTVINPIPEGAESGFATGLNNLGQTVGYATFGGKTVALFWNGRVPTTLPALPGDASATAGGINDAGEIAGYSADPTNTKLRGVIWRNGQPNDIGSVGAWDRILPLDINATGVVVGQLGSSTASGYAAFVYREEKMYELKNLVTNATGWELEYATGVNSHGQICGTGTLNGLRRGFVLTPE